MRMLPGAGLAIVHCKSRRSYELVHSRTEPMPRERIEPAWPVKTISKVSPTWAASMAVRPASPSCRRARVRASATRTSWQSATPAKPIPTPRRPNQNSTSPAPPAHWERQPRLAVTLIPRAEQIETEAGTCFGFIGTPPGRSSSAASCSRPSSRIPMPSSSRSTRPSRSSEPAPAGSAAHHRMLGRAGTSELKISSHAARHEAADLGAAVDVIRPDHGAAGAVRLGDHGVVGHLDPVAQESHAIMSVARVPVDIVQRGAVSVGAAGTAALAVQALEPALEGRVCVATVVAGLHGWADHGSNRYESDHPECRDRHIASLDSRAHERRRGAACAARDAMLAGAADRFQPSQRGDNREGRCLILFSRARTYRVRALLRL